MAGARAGDKLAEERCLDGVRSRVSCDRIGLAMSSSLCLACGAWQGGVSLYDISAEDVGVDFQSSN